MDWKQPVKAGDRLRASATWHNRVTEAARQVLEGEDVGEGEPRTAGVVRVKNRGTNTLGLRTVATISGVAIDPASTNTAAATAALTTPVLLVGGTATAEAGKFAVALSPIKGGDIGRAVVAGLAGCWLNVTDTAHKWAEHQSGTGLSSAWSGSARIIYSSGTGGQWALVRLGDQRDDCVVTLSGTNSVAGCYDGIIRTATALATGTSGAAILGAMGGGTNVNALVCNGYEVPAGTNGHALAVGTSSEYHGGWIIGSSTNGRAVVLIRSLAGEDCA
jgi:hypothetical protein